MNKVATTGHNNPPSEMEILNNRLNSYVDEAAEFKRLEEKPVPESIADEKEAGAVTDHIKLLKNLRSKVEDIFKKEKTPFWECCKAADAWINEYWIKIDEKITLASKPVLAFNKKREEEEKQRQLEIARLARIRAEELAAEAMAHENAGIDDTASELMNAAIQEETKAEMISDNAFHGVKATTRGYFSSGSNRKPWVGCLDSRAALDLDALRNYFSEDALNKAIQAAVRDGVRELRGAKIYQDEKLSIR